MDIESKKVGSILVVKPMVDVINYTNYIPFKSAFLEKFLQADASCLLLDFSMLKEFDSACIGVVITIGLSVVNQSHKKFALCGLHDESKKAFELAHIEQLFPVFSDVEAGLKALLSEQGAGRGEVIYCGEKKDLFNLLQSCSPNNLIVSKPDSLGTYEPQAKVIACILEESFINEKNIAIIHKKKNSENALIIGLVKSENPNFIKWGVQKTFSLDLSKDHAEVLMSELGKMAETEASATGALPQKLYETYAKTIPSKLEEINRLYDKFAKEKSPQAAQELRGYIHKIAGSAGTYGFVKAGESSRALTIFLDDALSKQTIGDDTIKKVHELIENIVFYFKVVSTPYSPEHKISIAPLKPGHIFNISSDFNFNNVLAKAADRCQLSFITLTDPNIVVECIKKLGYRPEIVILDQTVVTEKQSIFDLLHKIKENFLTDQMHFWVAFSEDRMNDRLEALKKGVAMCINKPISVDALTTLLKENITRTQKEFKVLILDDDQDMCNYFVAALNEINVKAEILLDPQGIYKVLDTFGPDLLLLDIHLPGLNGWTLLDVLRHDSRYKNLMVVIITADHDLQGMENLYYDDIWYKPLEKVSFQNKILKIMSKMPTEPVHADFTSSFKTKQEFESIIQMLLKVAKQDRPYYFVLIKSLDFNLSLPKKIQGNFLIEAEQLVDHLTSEDYLKTYLGNGFFGLFAGWVSKDELEKEIKEFIAKTEYKISIPIEGEAHTTFSALIVECDKTIYPDQFIQFGIEYFEKTMVLPSELRVINTK